MKQFISKLGAVVTAVLALVAVTVALLGIAATAPLGSSGFLEDKPYKVLIVRSGSMEPTIPVGSLVVSLKQPQYGVGEIVTYKSGEEYVTHRIVTQEGGRFITRGDANTSLDSPILPYSVIGKVRWTVPYAGYMVNFVKTPIGFSLLIVFPAFLIVIQEIMAIGRELEKERRRRKKLAEKVFDIRRVPARWVVQREAMVEKAATRRKIAQALAMILIALVAGLGGTKAYFSDVAMSTNNVFTAGTWGPPIATYLVINEVFYDVDSAHSITGQGGSNRGEWVEIYNPTGSPVNVQNWVLEDATESETLPNISIPAGGFLIICGGTQAEFISKWGALPSNTVYVQASGGKVGNGLDDSGERLRLKNNLASVIDAVSWGNDTTYLNPAPPDVLVGHSLERDPDGVDTNTAADFVDRTTPQPGL